MGRCGQSAPEAGAFSGFFFAAAAAIHPCHVGASSVGGSKPEGPRLPTLADPRPEGPCHSEHHAHAGAHVDRSPGRRLARGDHARPEEPRLAAAGALPSKAVPWRPQRRWRSEQRCSLLGQPPVLPPELRPAVAAGHPSGALFSRRGPHHSLIGPPAWALAQPPSACPGLPVWPPRAHLSRPCRP